MYCTEVRVTLLGLFGALIVIWRPGIVPLAPRRYAPGQWRSYPLDLVDKSRGGTLMEGGKM